MEMELWHLCNRGVDGKNIVRNQSDNIRFVHNLFEMNNNNPAGNAGHYLKYMDLRNPYIRKHDKVRKERELLVNIHGWCLMRNHYHVLVSEIVEGGVTKFLRKLNIGYANYFNEKYQRSGALFQGRTKKVLIERDAHFDHILHYIHANPLDYDEHTTDWRHGTIKNTEEALLYLDTYRWSSYLDYAGKHNFPSLLSVSLFKDVFPNYKKFLRAFLAIREHEDTQKLWLE